MLKSFASLSNVFFYFLLEKKSDPGFIQGALLHVLPISLTLFPICLLTNRCQIKAKVQIKTVIKKYKIYTFKFHVYVC